MPCSRVPRAAARRSSCTSTWSGAGRDGKQAGGCCFLRGRAGEQMVDVVSKAQVYEQVALVLLVVGSFQSILCREPFFPREPHSPTRTHSHPAPTRTQHHSHPHSHSTLSPHTHTPLTLPYKEAHPTMLNTNNNRVASLDTRVNQQPRHLKLHKTPSIPD